MEEKEAKVFKFKDIFKAWNHSFRFHRLFISAIALIISALIAYFLIRPPFCNISFTPGTLFPIFSFLSFKFILAIVLISLILFLAKMCISYSIRREVVDDEIFVGWNDVGKFLGKHIKTFVFFIIGWIVIFVLIALGQLFFYVIGMIPYVGSLWLSIMYLIPFGISLFVMLTLVVLLFCDSYGAVIIGVEQKSAMDSIISLYHLVKDKGIYIIVCHLISAIVGAIAFAFVLVIIQGAVQFTSFGAQLIMGGEFAKITLPDFFGFLNLIFPGLAMYSGAGGYYLIPGFIISICLIFVGSIGFSYFFTYITSAETFIYISSQDKFYPKKEEEIEEKLEEEKDEEKEEETEEKPEDEEKSEEKEEGEKSKEGK